MSQAIAPEAVVTTSRRADRAGTEVPHPARSGTIPLVEAGDASCREIHALIDRQRACGRDFLLSADAAQRVARLLGGPNHAGRACLLVRSRDARIDPLLRALDLLLGTAALLALMPLLAIIAVLVKTTSRGRVFHRGRVVGQAGEAFVWRKFRTMRAGCDDARHREAARCFIRDAGAGLQADGVYKLRGDDRVTRLGGVLRRHSLDELPQLLDVLAGRMSLVGPRPCLPYEWDLYERHHRARLDTKPGMTGLWQVLGRSRVEFEEMVLLDRLWACNRSAGLYLWLVLKTVGVVLSGRGGY